MAYVLDLVGRAALAHHALAVLSGGRQRLLLLLDEPLLSLDLRRQAGVVAVARRLQHELGPTVLFSAHELNPLLGAMDRVLYLGGSPAEIGLVSRL